MYFLKNDYSEGAHPAVMAALERTNLEATVGYGLDPYCAAAAEAIRRRFACPGADVHFLVGGTQTNFTAISAFLRPWEAVVAASTAHIAVHESGAIEATGHKVYVLPTPDGKLTPALIREAVMAHRTGTEEHMVLPRMVYLSESTELGTVYTLDELTAIRGVCRELGLYLYLDGARLSCALTCGSCGIEPEDLPRLCDAFYIGGTKNGLLFGEALVIVREEFKPYFRNCLKQRGAMLAKGRLLGVQFQAAMEDDLWLRLGEHANRMAAGLREGIRAAGWSFLADSPTNQIFPIFPQTMVDRLAADFAFEEFDALPGGMRAIRLVTSWATTEETVSAFLAALRG